MSLAPAGGYIGPTIGFSLSPYLCVNGFAGGWPSIFYLNGTLMIAWLVLFVLLTSDSPSTHKFITGEEKAYIIEDTRGNLDSKRKKPVSR
jgi:ACS family sodium-dependent inorganic phosphate cotransporter-like MFS transporter 5